MFAYYFICLIIAYVMILHLE